MMSLSNGVFKNFIFTDEPFAKTFKVKKLKKFKLLSCELDNFTLKSYIESFYFIIILKEIKS